MNQITHQHLNQKQKPSQRSLVGLGYSRPGTLGLEPNVARGTLAL